MTLYIFEISQAIMRDNILEGFSFKRRGSIISNFTRSEQRREVDFHNYPFLFFV